MTEPLSVAASVAGLISLGIQVTQSLVDFYNAYKNRDLDLVHNIHRSSINPQNPTRNGNEGKKQDIPLLKAETTLRRSECEALLGNMTVHDQISGEEAM